MKYAETGEIPVGRFYDPDTQSQFWYFPAVLPYEVNTDLARGMIKHGPSAQNANLMVDVDVPNDPRVDYREYNVRNTVTDNPDSRVLVEVRDKFHNGMTIQENTVLDDGVYGVLQVAVETDADKAYIALANMAEMVTGKAIEDWHRIA